MKPVRLEDQNAPYVEKIFPNDSCEKIIDLPYGGSCPISFQNELWYEFCRKLSLEPCSENRLDSEIFGIAEIETRKKYDVIVHPIPVFHPSVKSDSEEGEIRFFSLHTKSLDDLIFTLNGPLMPDKKNNRISFTVLICVKKMVPYNVDS